jgi:predicted O-methyltransferase YrrM
MSIALSHRFEDMIALQRLPAFPKSRFLPWTRSALRPSTILVLLQEIELHQHSCIVELGSGISTLYISLLLQGTNRRLISVDNDSDWQAVVRKQAASLGLSLDGVSFIHAPLAPYSDQRHSGNWYDCQAIKTGLGDSRIDCLLVDGPQAKADRNPRARYPALPALRSCMRENFVVFLDDCNRPGEQAIAKDWSNDFNLDGLFLPERGNVCLLHPAGAKRFNVV